MYGPSVWRFLHYFALHNIGRDFLPQVVTFLPEEWRTEWEDPREDEDLISWSLRLHNKLNGKLGKYAGWDSTDFTIAHKPECDFCEDKEFIFLFPWAFLHAVAKSMDPTAQSFLQQFNALYPDERSRGKFFTDEPGEEETVYDWTIRHHRRMNVEMGNPEEMYVPQPVPETTGIAGMAANVSDTENCCGPAITSSTSSTSNM
jgi:hypothetical protein